MLRGDKYLQHESNKQRWGKTGHIRSTNGIAMCCGLLDTQMLGKFHFNAFSNRFCIPFAIHLLCFFSFVWASICFNLLKMKFIKIHSANADQIPCSIYDAFLPFNNIENINIFFDFTFFTHSISFKWVILMRVQWHASGTKFHSYSLLS